MSFKYFYLFNSFPCHDHVDTSSNATGKRTTSTPNTNPTTTATETEPKNHVRNKREGRL